MADRPSRSRIIFVAAVAGILALNLVVLAAAYPETMVIDSGCCGNRPLAKDFSAFYTAAWRLFNDPGQVYNPGYVNDGEFHVLPQPEAYKYLPSFLLLVSPFLALPYQQALTAFDVFQFLLLPLIAWLVYQLTREKGIAAAVVVAVVALLLPSPTPHWSLSVAYYWQWAEGQSKVLETFLLLLSFYLGKSQRPYLSGIALGMSAFDPRFALVSLPLFVMYNRSRLSVAFLSGAAAFLLTNATLLVPGIGSGFLTMLFASGLTTPLYYYSLIPLLTVVALTLLNLRAIVSSFKGHIS
jgi:glycosyl transferase family 87